MHLEDLLLTKGGSKQMIEHGVEIAHDFDGL